MKTDIHPKWFSEAQVVCACGTTFTTGSTMEEIRVEICSKCHPFFTGEMRYVDSERKVDKFLKKRELAKQKAPELEKRKAKKAGIVVEDTGPKTLKEMLLGAQ